MADKITILGGGPAGLSAAYYAKLNGIPFELFEAESKVGGNCSTYSYEDFRFDSGAHRLHDKDKETTDLFRGLLGTRLKKIHVPSQIVFGNNYIDFPLTPYNLFKQNGMGFTVRALLSLMRQTFRDSNSFNFYDYAVRKYGFVIAKSFLLDYSEKLWGLPADKLSPEIAGKRLRGLSLKTFLLEHVYKNNRKQEHLDGSFYYPDLGIGTLFENLAHYCGEENIETNVKIIKIKHDKKRVTKIVTKDREIDIEQLVCTLPINTTLKLLDPAPPERIISHLNRINFRDVILIAFFLNKERVNENGSMYFPSHEFKFTRIYEPRNRSNYMSPKGKTSLIVEIPCYKSEAIWNNCSSIAEEVKLQLTTMGLITEGEVIRVKSYKIRNAYPILSSDYRANVEPIQEFLSNFDNINMTGRNGLFAYSHIHDHFIHARGIIGDLVNGTN